MSDPLTREEQIDLFWRANVVHLKRNPRDPRRSIFRLGEYGVECIMYKGLWIYQNGPTVYSSNPSGVHDTWENLDQFNWGPAREVLNLLRAETILEELADV